MYNGNNGIHAVITVVFPVTLQNLPLSLFPAPLPLYRGRVELKLYLTVSDRSRVSYILSDEIRLMASYNVIVCRMYRKHRSVAA